MTESFVTEPGDFPPCSDEGHRPIDLDRREGIRRLLAGLASTFSVVWAIMLTICATGAVAALTACALVWLVADGAPASAATVLIVLWCVGATYTVVRFYRMAKAPRDPAGFARDMARAADLSGLRIDVLDVIGQEGDSRGRRALLRLRRMLLMVRPALRRYDAVRELPHLAPFLPGALTATLVWSIAVVAGVVLWIVAGLALFIAQAAT